MSWPFRVTPPLLDVVAALVRAEREGRPADRKVYGWDLARQVGHTPSVYRALDRLLRAEWVDYAWELHNPTPGKPRRRFYWLTELGRTQAPVLLAQRSGRPECRVSAGGTRTSR